MELSFSISTEARDYDPQWQGALKAQIALWTSTGAYWVAQNYASRGDHDLALDWLERAYQQKDPVLVEIFGEPLFRAYP